jgi:hypothetical protein
MEKILLNKRKDNAIIIQSEEKIISKKLKIEDEESNSTIVTSSSSSQSSIIKFTRSFEHVDGNWPAFIYLKGERIYIYKYKCILLIFIDIIIIFYS